MREEEEQREEGLAPALSQGSLSQGPEQSRATAFSSRQLGAEEEGEGKEGEEGEAEKRKRKGTGKRGGKEENEGDEEVRKGGAGWTVFPSRRNV